MLFYALVPSALAVSFPTVESTINSIVWTTQFTKNTAKHITTEVLASLSPSVRSKIDEGLTKLCKQYTDGKENVKNQARQLLDSNQHTQTLMNSVNEAYMKATVISQLSIMACKYTLYSIYQTPPPKAIVDAIIKFEKKHPEYKNFIPKERFPDVVFFATVVCCILHFLTMLMLSVCKNCCLCKKLCPCSATTCAPKKFNPQPRFPKRAV